MELDSEAVFGNFVEAGDVKIHYGEVGTGAPLICLHGTGPGASAWQNFRHNVGAFADSFRTLLVDFPRYGGSDKIVIDAPRLDYLSGVVRDFMDAVGIDRAHFVGNSMGAQVSVKLSIDSPERIDRMVLVGPAVINHSIFTPMPTETVRMIASYYRGEGPSLTKMRRLMESLVYDASIVTDEAVQERYEASIAPEILEVNRGPHWAHQSIEHELERAQRPALLVWGMDDRASPLDHALVLLRKMPRARLYVMSRCGHSAQAEHPEEFNRVAVDFLTRRLFADDEPGSE